MRILVIGAGALGGYFGARLVRAGRDVTFMVRPQRAEQVARTGLVVTSPHGDFTVPARTITAEGIKQPFDLILLGVKSYSLDLAMEHSRRRWERARQSCPCSTAWDTSNA